MASNDEYKILFSKLEDAIKEQEKEYDISFHYDPIENERINELAKICSQFNEETSKEEYNSFTRS